MTDRQTYFHGARSWADDSLAQSARSRRIAWTVAGVAIGAMAFEAVALAMLAPLKTVQPITLLVDRQTGFVQALDPLAPQRIAADAALTDAYLAQYVMAREGFDRATIQRDYRHVALWSAGRARSSYLAGMAAGNPDSPLQAFPAGTSVTVRVKSVSRLRTGLSLVRFDTQRSSSDGRQNASQPWISVVRFRFSPAPMAFADRLDNPLGFQVMAYRRDAEAPLPESAAPTIAQPIPPTVIAQPAAKPEATAPITMRRSATRPLSPTIAGTTINRRDVPADQIPMGSPLSLGPSATRRSQEDPS